jgi:hypothetical protein
MYYYTVLMKGIRVSPLYVSVCLFMVIGQIILALTFYKNVFCFYFGYFLYIYFSFIFGNVHVSVLLHTELDLIFMSLNYWDSAVHRFYIVKKEHVFLLFCVWKKSLRLI